MIEDVKHRFEFLRTRVERRLRQTLQKREMPGRNLEVFPDDTFIASYPKSGNTWMRFLISNLLHPGSRTDFSNIDERVPTIYKATTTELAELPRPRVLKSHEYFDPRYPRVIYVVRDPRDVLLSYFHYHRRKGFIVDTESVAVFADRFLAGTVSAFGSWHENVASWLAARGTRPDFLLVRYEELLSDGATQLARIAAFLGRPVVTSEIDAVLSRCSFEVMRELEVETGGQSRHLKKVRDDIGFVRQGKAGTWQTELPRAVSARIETTWGPLLEQLGY